MSTDVGIQRRCVGNRGQTPILYGHEAKRGEIGALAVKLPLPPGALPTLWQQDERFRESYLAGFHTSRIPTTNFTLQS